MTQGDNEMSTDFKFVDNCFGLPTTIAREQIHHYFPWLSASRMRNLDWQGSGPEGAFKIGKKIIYPTDKLLKWLDSRVEKTGKKSGETDHSTQKACDPRPRSRGRKRKEQEIKDRRG